MSHIHTRKTIAGAIRAAPNGSTILVPSEQDKQAALKHALRHSREDLVFEVATRDDSGEAVLTR